MLHGYGHDEAPKEHVVGGVKIVNRNIFGRHQAKEGKTHLEKMVSVSLRCAYFTIGIIAVTGSGRASVSQ